jgi:riboflavin synthase
MFTGIVTARGRVAQVSRANGRLRLAIEAPYPDLAPGESVAVNGACLTVAERQPGRFTVDVIVTTRGRTRLGDLREGDAVNLERALALGDRLGGHLVQGHVDGVGEVVVVREEADALILDLRIPDDVAEVTVLHGSITVDGVSLTVSALPGPSRVEVALVPYTRQHTTLGTLAAGDRVHVEGDLIGKFVRQLIAARGSSKEA